MIEWNWWVLTLIPVAWFLQNCVHEGSHLLFGWLVGGKPAGFWPWPHKWRGRFYFARYAMLVPWTYDQPGSIHHISPVLAALFEISLLFLIGIFLSPAGRVWLLPFMVCGAVDAANWLRGFFWGDSLCDGKRFRYGGPV